MTDDELKNRLTAIHKQITQVLEIDNLQERQEKFFLAVKDVMMTSLGVEDGFQLFQSLMFIFDIMRLSYFDSNPAAAAICREMIYNMEGLAKISTMSKEESEEVLRIAGDLLGRTDLKKLAHVSPQDSFGDDFSKKKKPNSLN